MRRHETAVLGNWRPERGAGPCCGLDGGGNLRTVRADSPACASKGWLVRLGDGCLLGSKPKTAGTLAENPANHQRALL